MEEDEPQKKIKYVALKSRSERREPDRNKSFQAEEEDNDNSEKENSNDEEELSLLTRRVKQLWRKRNNNFRRPRPMGDRSESTSRGKSNKDITCYECKETGHYRNECPKLKKESSRRKNFKKSSFRTKKGLMATWDDSGSDSSELDSEEPENVALMANTFGNTSDGESDSEEPLAFVSTPVYREPHILDREPHIHLATPFEKLEVLCESLVDFENMKRNGVDLTEELKMQGWETYFQRLYGPVYTNLVKEFWRFTDSDDHYIVSYVLGVKIVITEKSIASLLNMEKTGGRCIYNINHRAKYLSQEINPTIFQQSVEGKHSKNKELHQNLRVWLKIILGTIHLRPASNSTDYINANKKCILYCIHKGMKLCLPALLFKYLRDSVKETRNNMKTRN
ncbi:hypothetical protein KIW84_065469 [Lathyrus oleraceus]|uniref:CCHC-type domain-containing protein n=1 Tax=Pisum sativum TaxID=3888 RepID=A0A9D4WFG4_PEA|nr:hypothetical protein KIW84_065469 [Pisum sativum]